MTAPFTSGGSWFTYDPFYNRPMTADEVALFQKLQSGDAVLKQQYIDKYGPIDPATGTGGWYDAWIKDQDYWNLRYLNQLATPEDMALLQQDSLTAVGYPYTIFQLNALKQMKAEGTLEGYLAGFKDPNLANYLASIMGISLQQIGFAGQTLSPTPVQPTGPTQPENYPTLGGYIPPGPSDPTGGQTTVPTGTTGPPTGGPEQPTTPTGVVTAQPTGTTPTGTAGTQPLAAGGTMPAIPMWVLWAAIAAVALALFASIRRRA